MMIQAEKDGLQEEEEKDRKGESFDLYSGGVEEVTPRFFFLEF